jgi:hypothetical protein
MIDELIEGSIANKRQRGDVNKLGMFSDTQANKREERQSLPFGDRSRKLSPRDDRSRKPSPRDDRSRNQSPRDDRSRKQLPLLDVNRSKQQSTDDARRQRIQTPPLAQALLAEKRKLVGNLIECVYLCNDNECM